MRRDALIQHIGASATPVQTCDLPPVLHLPHTTEVQAAVEILLTLSPEVSALQDGWVISADSRERKVIGALRAYAEAHPGKRIFRASAALGDLPPEDQMTDEQLKTTLARTGEFQLLPNAMIKRES